MRNEDGEILDALLARLPDGHSIGRRSCFEADGEEDNLLSRIGAGNLQAINGRIDNANVRSAGFKHEQIGIGTRHPQHIAERTEDYVTSVRNSVGLVNHLERSYANRTAWTVNEFNFARQETIQPVFDDTMRLPAANFHQDPWAGNGTPNLLKDFLGESLVAIFVEIFHGRPPGGPVAGPFKGEVSKFEVSGFSRSSTTAASLCSSSSGVSRSLSRFKA